MNNVGRGPTFQFLKGLTAERCGLKCGQKRRRVEHWDNAVSQGQYCARALMGDRTPFKHVLYFFSDVFDLS
jgi:hypothetical protein